MKQDGAPKKPKTTKKRVSDKPKTKVKTVRPVEKLKFQQARQHQRQRPPNNPLQNPML